MPEIWALTGKMQQQQQQQTEYGNSSTTTTTGAIMEEGTHEYKTVSVCAAPAS
jgi:hypothetical protein